jgi:hypothetical protein
MKELLRQQISGDLLQGISTEIASISFQGVRENYIDCRPTDFHLADYPLKYFNVVL